MSDYTFSNDFSAKDELTTGDPNKKILGADIDTEFEAIETAIATKYDSGDSPTFANITCTSTIKDSNGNESIVIQAAASATNHLQVVNSNAGSPSLRAIGDSTNVDLSLYPKGTGLVRVVNTSSSPQGIYTGLDTPVQLLTNTSTSSVNWTTFNPATVTSVLDDAQASMVKLRIQSKVAGSGTTASLIVDIAKSGKSGAPTSTLNSPTVDSAHFCYMEDGATGVNAYNTGEVNINLDGSYDFQYAISRSSGGGSVTSSYVNIILVGYYV